MSESPQLLLLWGRWQEAIGSNQLGVAAEVRAMYLALRDRQAAPQPPLAAYPNCAACMGTLAEIARLTGQLRAHQQLPGHSRAAERQ